MNEKRPTLAIESLPGLGPKSAEWLRGVGIANSEQLDDAGAVVAYLRVRQAGHAPSRNLLWALHGAITGKPWTDVTTAEKQQLETELDGLCCGSADDD